MGGLHKPAALIDGIPSIARVTAAVRTADPSAAIWIVGSSAGLPATIPGPAVRVVVEEPRHAGPLAAIATAVDRIAAEARARQPDVVLILAADSPHLTPAHLRTLIEAARASQAPATSRDAGGRLQQLCCAWPAPLLIDTVQALPDPVNRPVRLLFEGHDPVLVPVPDAVTEDFDTPDEYARSRLRGGDPRPSDGAGWPDETGAPVHAPSEQESDLTHPQIDPGVSAFLRGFFGQTQSGVQNDLGCGTGP